MVLIWPSKESLNELAALPEPCDKQKCERNQQPVFENKSCF
jgi:hypothetical protein